MALDVLDSLGMFGATAGLPEQVAAAARLAAGIEGLPRGDEVDNVAVLGMGASGLAGDVLAAVGDPFVAVPITVTRGYAPPSFVGPGTLCFAVSYSGDTEETVEAAPAELAPSWQAPLVPVPPEIPAARAALASGDWAQKLARAIGPTIPLIIGAGPLGAVAVRRWTTQINENAKAPAFGGVLPELCHNEIAGWGQHGDVTRQVFTLVELRHDEEHPLELARFDQVRDLLAEVTHDVVEVRAVGEGPLAQLLDLVMIGDVVSLHMAAQAGIDPGPVPATAGFRL